MTTELADGEVVRDHCPDCGCSDLRLEIRDEEGRCWPITSKDQAQKYGISHFHCGKCGNHFEDPVRERSLDDFMEPKA